MTDKVLEDGTVLIDRGSCYEIKDYVPTSSVYCPYIPKFLVDSEPLGEPFASILDANRQDLYER